MIVTDYAHPAALIVPHTVMDVGAMLERVAGIASDYVGVILLSASPGISREFVAAQRHPERFSVVGAEFDTPWVRDRSPIPVREGGAVRWVMPCMAGSDRRRDAALFDVISSRSHATAPLMIERGNLVGGPRGLAVSTVRVLMENGLHAEHDLRPFARQFGIRRWLAIPRFSWDPIAHSDTYLRFLSPRLAAVAWHPGHRRDQAVSLAIEQQLRRRAPGIEILRLPVRAAGDYIASPLNWIQLGRFVLAPRYPQTPARDVSRIRRALRERGVHVTFVDSPTAEYGGSLHCLTASVFV